SRPVAVPVATSAVTEGSAPQISLGFTNPTNALNIFLLATRYHSDPVEALQSSTPDLPDGPWFICRTLPNDATQVTDQTTDDNLIDPLSSLFPMAAGVPSIFAPHEFFPHNVASISGTLIAGGYTINRSIPEPYSDAENSRSGNVYVNFEPGNDLKDGINSLELAFAYEYTDGTISGIVDSGEVFQDSTVGITRGADMSGLK